ncbi:DNA phosphorothioation-dependent restriction protein DptG [Actinoplanes rectilineatus]|uniref:DNA phosphorothioation-dependent restriction protein DptG n=1 Tax=Actinoplanes rectilineatus TaxID=113571 RepID=UPI000B0C1D66|nr:DNA phosphorothioation-dependent restriction protein DptG [Actinoplanes rectilineatus]
MNPNVVDALSAVSGETGVHLSVSGASLLVDGKAVILPVADQGSTEPRLVGERAELLGIQGLLPTVPHGDDRDKLLWRMVAEAAPPVPDNSLQLDAMLLDELPALLALGPEASSAAALALEARFFNSKRLLPVHASLPLNYAHSAFNKKKQRYEPAGYTMFNGGILPFMLWHSGIEAPNVGLIERLLETVAQDEELTALDRRFLTVAMKDAPRPSARPDASELSRRYQDSFTKSFRAAGKPFCEPSMALFERDLQTVLDTELPRPERARWLTLVISLHLSLRLYRISVGLGAALDLAVAAAGQVAAPAGATTCECHGRDLAQLASCPFAGAIRFRTSSGRFRPARVADGCHASYKDIDRRRLLDMPATLVTRTLACRVWAALGGGLDAEQLNLSALTEALEADDQLRRVHGAACAGIAVLHHDAARKGKATLAELHAAGHTDAARPGLHALREDVRQMRRRDLRRQSTDVVNQLMLAGNVGAGSLITRNGPSFTFFEVDEELLLLLVRLICREREVPVEGFFDHLRTYGLRPQDEAERESLISTLERLGLLERYSDAGEASFVHYA